MTADGIVHATERLYRSLFTAAAGYAVGMALWGLVIAPLNAFRTEHVTSLVVGVVLSLAAGAAFYERARLFTFLRRHASPLLLVAVLGVAILWIDGGWRSSYYLASYTAIGLAAVVGGLRWSLGCAAVLAAGYLGGLAIHGYSWAELKALKDADSVIANTGGYFIAAYFAAMPVAWLGGYVARIHQVASVRVAPDASAAEARKPDKAPTTLRTARLSPREVQVVQLLATGMSNEEIAERLVVSPRTVQSHVRAAMRKTSTSSRTELAVLAVREGLIPDEPPPEAR